MSGPPDSSSADALHRRGLIAARAGRIDDAVRLFAAAGAHYDQGVALAGLGRYADAIACYDAAVAQRPDHAEAWNNRGVALLALGRAAEAVASYDRALAAAPDYAVGWANRGNALLTLGDAAAALASYDRALALKPDYARAQQNRAAALAALAQQGAALLARCHALFRGDAIEAALACYDAALAAAPAAAEAHFFRANALHRLQRPAEALAACDRAVALRADYPEAWNNRGNALLALDRTEDALASFRTALDHRPDYAEAHNNASVALRSLGRLEEARAAAGQALALRPAYAEALTNRGNAALGLGAVGAALADYAAALAIMPEFAGGRFNQALALLLTGDFAAGWAAYEARWQTSAMARAARRFPQPLWLGEADLAGRTILLHAEQGNGDTLQFCRYAPLVAAQGARVVLEVQRLQVPLMRSLRGPAQVLAGGAALPAFDLHCPLLSLPLAFATRLETIPADIPYLAPPPAHAALWRERLGPRRQPRIGLAWSGSLSHRNDRNRSLPLELLRPLLGPLLGRNLALYCLQRELRTADIPAFAGMQREIAHFGRALRDFADTAALTAEMDLVIAVDTAVAHLAGALGKELWVLLPFAPDWRWLLDRADSPWYPTARLFRQRRPGDWSDVLEAVFAALAARFPGG